MSRRAGVPSHWVRANESVRIPRWHIVLDTEAHRADVGKAEMQTWRCGVAARWRDDTVTMREPVRRDFTDPRALWEWVSEWTRASHRTIVWAHNLAYDLRIGAAFHHLPALGWSLEWCNLDRGATVCNWRRDGATLLMVDSLTYFGASLERVGAAVGIGKLDLPAWGASDGDWLARCRRDVDILTAAVKAMLEWIDREQLCTWQPTGAGLAWGAWRHRFLDHKVLVHSDDEATAAERAAMHTGRCEVWQAGRWSKQTRYEWDMTTAYCTLAERVELPRKLHDVIGPVSIPMWRRLRSKWALLSECEVTTEVAAVPANYAGRTLWPVGTFTTMLWDAEVALALETGATVRVLRVWRYLRAPVLARWASWTLDQLGAGAPGTPAVVRLWVKHQSRALIGRLAVRYREWADFGANPGGGLGVSTLLDVETGEATQLLAVGDRTQARTGEVEGENSLPSITGAVMAACRVELWRVAQLAGLDHVSYLDTDSVLVDRAGHEVLSAALAAGRLTGWRCKAEHGYGDLRGPRNVSVGADHRVAGIPRSATRTGPREWHGEVWRSLAYALGSGSADAVLIEPRRWRLACRDYRRRHDGDGPTAPYRLTGGEVPAGWPDTPDPGAKAASA